MSSLQGKINEAQCKELHCAVDTPSGRFLCFSHSDGDTFKMCASDGLDLWTMEVETLEELEAHCELSEISTGAYLAKLRSAFQSGDVSISQTGVKVTLTFGRGGQALDLDLYEAKAAQKRILLQHVLFRLTDKVADLESKLQQATQRIDGMAQQNVGAASSSSSGILDLGDGNQKKNAPKIAKQVGMSVVNPASRKRQAPKGIEWD